ncbi:hypothetical protein MMC06_003822 [Schaereria dolodes]|nr:hypothetical protein [Schaereria dolodes]
MPTSTGTLPPSPPPSCRPRRIPKISCIRHPTVEEVTSDEPVNVSGVPLVRGQTFTPPPNCTLYPSELMKRARGPSRGAAPDSASIIGRPTPTFIFGSFGAPIVPPFPPAPPVVLPPPALNYIPLYPETPPPPPPHPSTFARPVCPTIWQEVALEFRLPEPNTLLFFSKVNQWEWAFSETNNYNILPRLWLDYEYPNYFGCNCPWFWELASIAISWLAVGDVHVLLPDGYGLDFPRDSPLLTSYWLDWELPVLLMNLKVCRIWRHKVSGGRPELIMVRSSSPYCGGPVGGVF